LWGETGEARTGAYIDVGGAMRCSGGEIYILYIIIMAHIYIISISVGMFGAI
jgi:hypothetical protein